MAPRPHPPYLPHPGTACPGLLESQHPRVSEAPAEALPPPCLSHSPTVRSAPSEEFHQRCVVRLGLDMAPCPQPDSCLVCSPLGLICLSLLLFPAAGASSCP